ncbi:GumC family protein [Microvirga sp. M2]|uniref:GumC family protein n=1 Tax=Microvirga sp. M2 TaxID=3073270 RepID=UPI0039C3A5DE
MDATPASLSPSSTRRSELTDRSLRIAPAQRPGAHANDAAKSGRTAISHTWRAFTRRFLWGFIPIVILTAIAWPYIPRRYVASAMIVLRPADTASAEDTQPWRQTLDEGAIQSEIDRITSPKLTDIVIRKHNLLKDPEFASPSHLSGIRSWLGAAAPAPISEAEVRRRLADHFSVQRDRKSYTIKLGFWSGDAAKAAAMTRTLLAAYLDEQMIRKRELVTRAAMLTRAEAELRGSAHRAAEAAVENLLMTSGLADTGSQVALDQRLAVLSTEAAQAHARAIEASIRLKTLRDAKAAGALDNAPEILASPTVRQLKEALAAALSKTAVLGPETQAITARITEEAERIVKAAEIELAGWRQREDIMQAEIETLSEKLILRRQNELRLEELKSRAAFTKEAYDRAVTQMLAQQARVNAVMPDAEIVTDAEEPLQPAYPQVTLTAFGSLLVAIMVGFLLAWRSLVTLFRFYHGSSTMGRNIPDHAVPDTDPMNRALQTYPPAAYRTELSTDHVSHL